MFREFSKNLDGEGIHSTPYIFLGSFLGISYFQAFWSLRKRQINPIRTTMNHPFETPNMCWFCGQNLPSPATDCDHCSGAVLPTEGETRKALSWTDYSFGSRGPSPLEKPSATFLPDARAVFQEEPRVAIRVGDMHRAVLLLKDPENGTRVSIMKRTAASIEKKIEVETLKWEDLTYKKGMLLNYIVREILDLDEEYPLWQPPLHRR